MNHSTRFFLLISAVLIIFLITACGASRYSNKRKGEVIQASVSENPEVINYALFQQQEIPTLADRGGKDRGIGLLMGMSVMGKGMAALINMEKKKYTASWKQSLTGLYFYDQLSTSGPVDPIGMQFNGFDVLRTVKTGKNNTDTALFASFEPDLSNPYEIINNSFFRLKLKEIKIDYSKAKVSATKWYLPWSWGGKKKKNKLNLDLEIIFRSSWYTADGHLYDNAEIGRFLLTLRDVPMNPDDPEREKYFTALQGQTLLGKCAIVPRSYGSYYSGNQLLPCYGQGEYSIETNVRESGSQNFILQIIGKATGGNGNK